MRTLICFALALFMSKAAVAQEAALSKQTVYLPIYSHVYHGNPDRKTGKTAQSLVSAHVSIRNTDLKSPITVTSARYYDTDGKPLREFVPTAKQVPPLGTLELFVPHSDSSGGSGANFIIEWTAERPVNPPLIDALHGDVRESRTLFFITSGRPIQARQ